LLYIGSELEKIGLRWKYTVNHCFAVKCTDLHPIQLYLIGFASDFSPIKPFKESRDSACAASFDACQSLVKVGFSFPSSLQVTALDFVTHWSQLDSL
jgi:hypothetical protein